jgi:hypothetical protein
VLASFLDDQAHLGYLRRLRWSGRIRPPGM